MNQNVSLFWFFICPIAFSTFLWFTWDTPDDSTPPQSYMSTDQIIAYHGYPVEEHKVRTEDGYILTLFRIPHGKNNKVTKRSRPVILQHGILCSSADFVILLQKSLPFLLADEGHEVWLPNSRGSNYSLEHENMTDNDNKYWDFSFDEMARYDVVAIIDYVLKTSKAEDLNWIGHSMGCTMLFIAINNDPYLNDKVHKMVLYAPAVYEQNIICPFFRVSALFSHHSIVNLGLFTAGGRFLPTNLNNFVKVYGPSFCAGKIASYFCNTMVFLFSGFNWEQLTNNTAPLVAGHMPSVASMKTLAHYAQFIQSGKFEGYDHKEGNLKKYGSPNPPLYELSKVKISALAFYGLNDWLAAPKDVLKTVSELGNLHQLVQVNHPKWAHLDFLYGKDADILVYQQSLQFIAS